MQTPSHAGRLITPTMLVVALVLVTVPFWITSVGLYHYIGVEILIWAIYAFGFNLLLGTAGLPSFGHGAFFGIGAYAFGLTQFNVSTNLWVCLLGGILAASLAGLLVAAFIARRRGIYFALLTIAFGQVFWFIAMKARDITGGEDGLLPIRRLPVDLGFVSFDLTDNVALYFFVLALFLVTVMALWRLTNSPFGRVLSAIRQSELRAAHLGYRVVLFKVLAIIVSAAFAGLAGSLFAMAQGGAFPEVMALHYSGYIVMMVLVGGGMVSFWGPLVGVIVFLLARDVLGSITLTWMLWFGLLFVAVILFKPEGIAGAFQDLRRRFTRQSPAQPAARSSS
jgi:branched-chain amino acid transport system permease protein